MRFGGIFDYDVKAERLHVVNAELEDPNVWNGRITVQLVIEYAEAA